MVKVIKYIGIGFAICIIAIAALIGAAVFTLKTDRAQLFIQNHINGSIYGSISWENIRFSLIAGDVEVTNGILKGPSEEDLARFDRLSCSLSWRALLDKTILLSPVIIEKPRAAIHIESDGSVNLAHAFDKAGGQGKKSEESFPESNTVGLPLNIVIRDLSINEGSISYSTAENSFQTAVDHLNLSADANLMGESGGLALTIGTGTVRTPAVDTRFDNLKLKIRLKDRMVSLDTIQGNIGGGTFEILGKMDFRDAFPGGFMYAAPILNETAYTVSFRGKGIDVTRILQDSTLKGIVTSSFTVEGKGFSPQTLLARLQAELRAERFAAGAHAAPIDIIAKITANLNKGLATVERLDAEAGGITVEADGTFDLTGQTIAANLELDAPNLSAALSSIGVKGIEGGAHLIGTLSGTAAQPVVVCGMEGSRLRYRDFAIGDVQSAVSLDHSGTMRLQSLVVRNNDSELRITGAIRLLQDTAFLSNPSLSLDLESPGINLEDFMETAKGTVSLRGHVEGTVKRPRVDCDIRTENLRLYDFAIGDVQARAALDGSGLLQFRECTVRNKNSDLAVSGTAQLFEGATLIEDPLFKVDFSSKSLFLQDFTDRAKGKISCSGHGEGTVKAPHGTIEIRGTDMDLGIQKLSNLSISARLDGRKVYITPFRATVAPGEVIEGSGWLSFDKAYRFNLASTGISLRSIDRLKDQKTAEGIMAFDLFGEGVLDNPCLNGTIVLHNMRIEGREFEYFKIDLDVKDGIARASGALNFNFEGAYDLFKKDFRLSADFKESSLAPYFEIAGRKDLRGTATGTLHVKGNADVLDRIEASADFTELTLFFKDLQLLRTENFTARYGNSEFVISPCRFELLGEGHLEMEGKGKVDGPISLGVDGKLPLGLSRPFVEDIDDITGNLLLSARVEGTWSAPDIRTRLALEEIGFTMPVLSQKLHHVNGLIEATPRAVTINNIKGSIDSGTFDMNGTVAVEAYKPGRMDIAVNASALPLRIPDTMDALLNAHLAVSGSPERSKIQGEVVLLEGTYYKDVNLNLVERVTERKREIEPSAREIGHPFINNMELDVSVKRRSPFVIDNNLARLEISPDLLFTGTLGNPAISGRAEVDSGTITYHRRTFEVTKGIIDFLNPYKIDPTIDIAGEIQTRTWKILLDISGTPDHLAFNLASEPQEEDGDILSLLLFGKTTREFAEGKGTTTRSTKEMLAEMLATTFGEEIKETTGLDIFEVETGTEEEETEAASETIKVTLGKKLTKRMTVKYAAETKDGEMIQRAVAEYKFLENILLSGFQDSKGIFGGELLFRLEFR